MLKLHQALNNYQHIPDTQVGLIGLATQLEANLPRKSRSDTKQSGSQRDPDPKGKGKAQCAQPKGNEPNTNQRSSKPLAPRSFNRRRPNLSKEEREHRMKNNLCYQCGKEGHHASNCPDRPAVPTKDNKPENSKSQ